ncbi:MAG: hypothetical protein WDM89_19120 [Rhizomicrobium sp.]
MKLIVEPGGSAGLAALLGGKYDARGKVVAVVLTGGNCDFETVGVLHHSRKTLSGPTI